jgi:hypothetical protein
VLIEQLTGALPAAPSDGLREASLEGHLENERKPDSRELGLGRDEPRRAAGGAKGVPFADDFQARMAYQTLRAVALERERGPLK